MFKPLSEEKHREWEEKIRQQRESGLNVARWCRENQINYNGFIYWTRRYNPSPILNRSSFKELSEHSKKTGVSIEYRGACIRLDKQFDSSVLKQCLSILMGISC